MASELTKVRVGLRNGEFYYYGDVYTIEDFIDRYILLRGNDDTVYMFSHSLIAVIRSSPQDEKCPTNHG